MKECPDSGSEDENAVCYNTGAKNAQLMRCNGQCLGGCLETEGKPSQVNCFACKHVLGPMNSFPNGYHSCWDTCSKPFLKVSSHLCFVVL